MNKERMALMAYIIDRQAQFEDSHFMQARIADWLGDIAQGQHLRSWEHGEYDDLKDRIKKIIENHKNRTNTPAEVKP